MRCTLLKWLNTFHSESNCNLTDNLRNYCSFHTCPFSMLYGKAKVIRRFAITQSLSLHSYVINTEVFNLSIEHFRHPVGPACNLNSATSWAHGWLYNQSTNQHRHKQHDPDDGHEYAISPRNLSAPELAHMRIIAAPLNIYASETREAAQS